MRVADEATDYRPRHAPRGTADQLAPEAPEPIDVPGRNLRRRKARRRQLIGTVATVCVAAVVAMLVKMFVMQAFLIPSGSMENTLRVGDHVLTDRLSYQLHGIHRGDVVVFSGAGTWDGPAPVQSSSVGRWWHDLAVRAGVDRPDGTIYVKRVIGLPGDTVACCDAQGRVTVNGIPLDESSYVHDDSYWPGSCTKTEDPSSRCFAPVKVADGTLWVMGDHRSVSDDSRRHLAAPGGGAVDSSRVVGKAVLVLWPRNRLGTIGTPATFAGVPAVAMGVLPLRRRRRRARTRSRPASHVVP
jgi:signal peptidase I